MNATMLTHAETLQARLDYIVRLCDGADYLASDLIRDVATGSAS